MGKDGPEVRVLDGDEDEDPTTRRAGDPDRRCAVCSVKLSLYNPGPHCWNHTIGYPWRGPSAKPRFG